MGYIKDFDAKLSEMLAGALPEERLKEVLTFVKQTVIESYRNGIEHGKLTREETQKPARKWRPAKRRT